MPNDRPFILAQFVAAVHVAEREVGAVQPLDRDRQRIRLGMKQLQPTSADELEAQRIMEGEFDALGLSCAWHSFEFNDSLYKNLVLHFGLGSDDVVTTS